jgi:two-component system, OmpR family, sensor histidine kinase MprB
MSFRRRIVVLAAAAVALAVVLSAVVTYAVVRRELRAGVDASLRELEPQVAVSEEKVRAVSDEKVRSARGEAGGKPRTDRNTQLQVRVPGAAFGGASGVAQITLASGEVLAPPGPRLPVTAAVRAVGAGKRKAFLRDETVRGVHVRILTTRAPNGAARTPGGAVRSLEGATLQVAKPLADVDDALARLRWILLGVTIGGVGLAAGFGVAVSRAATRPLGRLTATAERVSATGDLRHRLEGGGDDEPGRLAASFNAMLAALEASREAQRQLVADASHELRTPLTAIRANVELLERARDLPVAERAEVLAAVRGQLEDLTVLVGDLVDLARPGERAGEAPEELRLDELVEDAVERARRHAPSATFTVCAEPCVVRGSRARLARAVGNLLDNAVKWSPPGEPIEVAVRAGEVTVRDHGPGIAEADLPHVFDRFYRATAARAMPGSGLGLAIVRQVAETHGGGVSAAGAPGGGACLRLVLPV